MELQPLPRPRLLVADMVEIIERLLGPDRDCSDDEYYAAHIHMGDFFHEAIARWSEDDMHVFVTGRAFKMLYCVDGDGFIRRLR